MLIDFRWSHLSGRFCLCWSGGVPAVLVRSDLVALFCFPKSCVFALVCIGLVNDALLQAGLFSLSSVLSCSLWSVLVWSTPLHSRLVCSGCVGRLFLYSFVMSELVCPVCYASAGFNRSGNMVVISNAVAFHKIWCWLFLVWFACCCLVGSNCSVLVSSVRSFPSVLVWRGPYCPGLVVLT